MIPTLAFALIIAAGPFATMEECQAANRGVDIPTAYIVQFRCEGEADSHAPESAPLPKEKPE